MKTTPELTNRTNQIAAAFQAVHNGIKGDAIALKLKMYFGGLLVNELTEWYRENIGESRGGDQTESKNPTVGFLPLQAWMEEQLGVTRSTAHRYRTFWCSIAEGTQHIPAVKALNAWWIEHKPALALPAPAPAKKGKDSKTELAITAAAQEKLNVQTACGLLATDLQSLLEEADELGLHELFEKPAKDVGPEVIEKAKNDNEDRQLQLALQFWGPQGEILKRLNRKDYLRLPPREREALATTLEETLHEIKDTLKAAKR